MIFMIFLMVKKNLLAISRMHQKQKMRKKSRMQKKPTNKEKHNFLVEKAKISHKEWMTTGRNLDKKYFGYLNKKSMSVILVLILILVAVGDFLLIFNLFSKQKIYKKSKISHLWFLIYLLVLPKFPHQYFVIKFLKISRFHINIHPTFPKITPQIFTHI